MYKAIEFCVPKKNFIFTNNFQINIVFYSNITMSEATPKEHKANPIKSFVSGGFGGICTVVTGHPLDTIKVCIQFLQINLNSLYILNHKGTFTNHATSRTWSKTHVPGHI